MSITAERKAELIHTYARGEADTGSAEVQVAILSERIDAPCDYRQKRKPSSSPAL